MEGVRLGQHAVDVPGVDATRLVVGKHIFDVIAGQSLLPSKGHDVIRVRPGFAGVADGVTPQHDGPPIDVADFSRRALEQLDREHQRPAAAMYRRAIEALRGYPRIDGTPACTVAEMHVRGDQIVLTVMADALIVVRAQGKVTLLRDGRVSAIDERHVGIFRQLLEKGHTVEEARHQLAPLLKEQQRHINQPDWYYVFANDPVASEQILRYSLPASQVDAVLLCSDGYSRIWDTVGIVATPEELLDRTLAEGPGPLMRELRERESVPDSLRLYPRLGEHDDASVVVVSRRGDRGDKEGT